MNREKWIDLLRGFCMMSILWFHTEMYYVGYDKTPYTFYVGDVLAVFFIISGYLLYKPTSIDFNKRIHSILRYIVLPYFIFTTFIAIGKYFFYQDRSISLLIIDVLSGHASWFITALIISQLIFLLFLRISKENIIFLAVLSCFSLILSYYIGNSYNPSPLYYEQNIWHLNEALFACFLLFTGYFYHRYERIINYINTIIYTSLLFIIVCIIKYIIYKNNMQLVLGPIIVSNYPIFIIDLLCSSLLLIQIFKRLPSIKMIEWTGAHSIVYYFLCGGIPVVISTIFHHMNITDNSYLYILGVFIVVYLVSTGVTWLIYRYIPFISRKKLNAGA